MKAIIFDSSTLISFAMNGLLPELKELKKIFRGSFLITQEVKQEAIDKPLTIKRFELEGVKLNQLIAEGVLELPNSLDISDSEISRRTKEFMDTANNLFYGRGREVRLLDLGEASCLALSEILTKKNIENVLAIDERTLRILIEKPKNLSRLLERKLHTKITMKSRNYKMFEGFKIIRSSELVYVLHKKGLSRWKSKVLLDALLYAVKFKGCAISGEEIKEIKRIG